MYVIFNEDGIKYFINHTRDKVEVLASYQERTVSVEARTRKEAIDKAKKALQEQAPLE